MQLLVCYGVSEEKEDMQNRSAALELLRVARIVMSEDEVILDPISVAEQFTASIARELMKYRKSHGLISIRQNYKGTGSQRATRQLWVRFTSGAVDVWLHPGSYDIGGVTMLRIPGQTAYGNRTPADIAKEIAEKINMAFNAKVAKTRIATTFLDGMRKQQAAKKVNEIMARHTRGFFTDEYWQPINAIFKDLREEGIDWEMISNKYIENDKVTPTGKMWRITVSFKNEKLLPASLYGTITASGGGSVQSPLDRYDVTAYCS